MKIYLTVVLLILASLACTTQAALPTLAKMAQPAPILTPAPVQFEVCGTDPAFGLNVRTGAGMGFETIGLLHNGEIVTVTGIGVVTDDTALWLPIKGGWVNNRYLCEIDS